MAIRKNIGRIIFILILGGFIAAILFQGKEGGELVYKYGANNERVADMSSDGDDAKEELEEAEEKLSELKEKYDALVAETKESETAKEEAPKPAEAVVEEEKKEEAESNETAPSTETSETNSSN